MRPRTGPGSVFHARRRRESFHRPGEFALDEQVDRTAGQNRVDHGIAFPLTDDLQIDEFGLDLALEKGQVDLVIACQLRGRPGGLFLALELGDSRLELNQFVDSPKDVRFRQVFEPVVVFVQADRRCLRGPELVSRGEVVVHDLLKRWIAGHRHRGVANQRGEHAEQPCAAEKSTVMSTWHRDDSQSPGERKAFVYVWCYSNISAQEFRERPACFSTAHEPRRAPCESRRR